MKPTEPYRCNAIMAGGLASLCAYMLLFPVSMFSLMFVFPALLPFVGAALCLWWGLAILQRIKLPMLLVFFATSIAAAVCLATISSVIMVVYIGLILGDWGNPIARFLGFQLFFLPWGIWSAWPAAVCLWCIFRKDPGMQQSAPNANGQQEVT